MESYKSEFIDFMRRGAPVPRGGAQHPSKPVLGVLLQRHLHPAGGGRVHGLRHHAEPDDRLRGHAAVILKTLLDSASVGLSCR